MRTKFLPAGFFMKSFSVPKGPEIWGLSIGQTGFILKYNTYVNRRYVLLAVNKYIRYVFDFWYSIIGGSNCLVTFWFTFTFEQWRKQECLRYLHLIFSTGLQRNSNGCAHVFEVQELTGTIVHTARCSRKNREGVWGLGADPKGIF